MTDTTTNTPNRTKIVFDLAAELTPEELAKFESAANEAKAENLTEHFLNLTIRPELKNLIRPQLQSA